MESYQPTLQEVQKDVNEITSGKSEKNIQEELLQEYNEKLQRIDVIIKDNKKINEAELVSKVLYLLQNNHPFMAIRYMQAIRDELIGFKRTGMESDLTTLCKGEVHYLDKYEDINKLYLEKLMDVAKDFNQITNGIVNYTKHQIEMEKYKHADITYKDIRESPRTQYMLGYEGFNAIQSFPVEHDCKTDTAIIRTSNWMKNIEIGNEELCFSVGGYHLKGRMDGKSTISILEHIGSKVGEENIECVEIWYANGKEWQSFPFEWPPKYEEWKKKIYDRDVDQVVFIAEFNKGYL